MDNLLPVITRPQPGAAPAMALAPSASSIPNAALATLWERHGAEPVQLLRTTEGRKLSTERYRRAEEFALTLSPEFTVEWKDFLYYTGIVTQLALSSHLLDVGFPDAWCARHIGLHVDRSLAYANASAFGYECAETARLVQVLAPYWKWSPSHLIDRPHPSDGGFTPDEVRTLLRALMDHVRQITGHGRPRSRKKV